MILLKMYCISVGIAAVHWYLWFDNSGNVLSNSTTIVCIIYYQQLLTHQVVCASGESAIPARLYLYCNHIFLFIDPKHVETNMSFRVLKPLDFR